MFLVLNLLCLSTLPWNLASLVTSGMMTGSAAPRPPYPFPDPEPYFLEPLSLFSEGHLEVKLAALPVEKQKRACFRPHELCDGLHRPQAYDVMVERGDEKGPDLV
jgi:hypothetical protein